MLSKICSKISRYPSQPRLSRNARLSQLNKDCLSALKKVEINSSLQKTMIDLDTRYCLDIALAADEEYQSIPASAIFEPDDSPEAEERARGLQIARGLSSTTRFLENYSITAPGTMLEAAITTRHKNFLLRSLHYSFPLLPESDQRAFVCAVQPKALDRLGMTVSSELRKLSTECQASEKPQLDVHHVLALLDYCSSESGSFNSINDGKRTWQFCGVDKLALITSCLSSSLEEALGILSLHAEFRYHGPAYKGIALANAAGQFRLSRMQPGMQYTSAHWSSATCIEKKNYSNKSADERCSKLVILDSEGVRVHMFNDNSSADEGEVMIRPKPFYFLSTAEVGERMAKPVANRPTIYCTMKPVTSEACGRPLEPHAVLV